jgi:hypothetical protein
MRLAIGIAVVLLTSVAHAVAPQWLSTHVDRKAGTVVFTVMFEDVPDFTTIDTAGRQADSFAFFVDSEQPSPIQDFYQAAAGQQDATGKSIIWGESIHSSGVVSVVWVDSVSGSTANGGWGRTVTTVPFTLHGAMLRFEVPLLDLQDDDGVFWYYVTTVEYGSADCLPAFAPLSNDAHYRSPEICWHL